MPWQGILRELYRQFGALLDSTTDAIFMKDLEGRYIFANQATAGFLGLPVEEVSGKDDHALFSPETARAIVEADRRVLASGETSTFEEVGTVGGVTRIFSSTKGVFRDAQGEVVGLFGISRDITQQKEMERQLALQAEELRRSNADLERFAYVASHDLQEPLRMVTSYVQLLQRRYQGRLDSDADEFIAYAVDGAARMRRLIQDLLAYSRVGTRRLAPEEVDLEAVLASVLEDLHMAVGETGAEVTHGPLPSVTADPVQIHQLLQNLIGNALKFRSAAPLRVHVEAERGPREWTVRVRDNGIGVDPQFFDRIFLMFQRLHGRHEHPGTGIGLAICKRIVESHGGRIWIDSVPGEGATLSFTLPD